MSIPVYHKGQLVRLSMNFKDVNDADVDPAAVTLKVLDPSGNTTTYTYAVSPVEIEKSSIGDYYADVEADEEGEWHYEWEGTGAGDGVKDAMFVVASTPF